MRLSPRLWHGLIPTWKPMDLGGPDRDAGSGGNPIGRWSPPPIGVVKLNTDAGILNRTGTGMGCVIRDWMGRFIGASALKERGAGRPIEAEAKAIWMGLKEANRRGLSPIIVESDCEVLIRKLRRKEMDRTELGSWCEEILRLAETNENLSGEQVIWSFVSRTYNGAAHWLAHSIGVWNSQVVWVDEPPLSLLVLLEADMGRSSLGLV
ncbi:unnamed protein product [Linum trigynum]|uniref:RNase H type-1 domain-containing protein n=1 Tax=Linum trigynum TaxID=586398 RepID=A0AAV2D4I6_9ROSI